VRDVALLHAAIGEACVSPDFSEFLRADRFDGGVSGFRQGRDHEITTPPRRLKGTYETEFGEGRFYWSQQELVLAFICEKGPYRNISGLNEHELDGSTVHQSESRKAAGSAEADRLDDHSVFPANLTVADPFRAIFRKDWIILGPIPRPDSNLVTAEAASRLCVGVDVDPAGLDDIIQTWQRQSGIDAVNAATGETFLIVAARRTRWKPSKTPAKPTDGRSQFHASRAAGKDGRHV